VLERSSKTLRRRGKDEASVNKTSTSTPKEHNEDIALGSGPLRFFRTGKGRPEHAIIDGGKGAKQRRLGVGEQARQETRCSGSNGKKGMLPGGRGVQ